MLKLPKEIPAMKKILVSGNNKITEFIHNFLPLKGFEVIDITQLSAFQDNLNQLKNAECILDLNNTDANTSDSMIEYDPEFIKEQIDLAKSLKTSYILAYQEPENTETESFLVNILDFVDDYCKETNIDYAKILIGDIYGTELTTSQKLKSILTAIVEETPVSIDNDSKDYYLINQTDFIEGLEAVINSFKSNRSPLKTYTLLPEEPLTEIELVHFIDDLNELDAEINYSNDSEKSSTSVALGLNLDVNYPRDWYPKIDLENGLKALMTSYGIPVLGTESEELAEEEFLLNEEREIEDFDDPLINMWDDSLSSDFDNTGFDEFSDKDINTFREIANTTPKKNKKLPKISIPKKNLKVKATALAILLMALLTTPTFSYNKNYHLAKDLLSEATFHLNTLNFDAASEKSQLAVEKFENIKNNNIYIRMVPFKYPDSQLLETTSRSVNYLATNFQYKKNENVLGINTFSGIDKAVEIINLLDAQKSSLSSDKYIEIRELISNKDILQKIKEVNDIMPEVLGYNQKQRYLALYLDTDYTKTFGEISHYSLINLESGVYNLEKTSKIDDLDNQMILNSADGIGGTTSLLNNHMFIEDGLKEILNVYNFISKEKINGLILITPTAAETLDSNQEFNSIEEANSYTLQLMQNSSNSVKKLINGLNNNDIFIVFENENYNISARKNNWTGRFSTASDDSIYLISESQTNSNLIENAEITALYNDDSYRRTIKLSLSNPQDSESVTKLKFALPKEAMLTQAMLKGTEEKNITRNFGLELQNGLIIYSTTIKLNPLENLNLEVNYESVPQNIEDGYLSFYLENTPNFKNIPITITFSYPGGIPNTTKIPENLKINNNSVQYTGELKGNISLSIPL